MTEKKKEERGGRDEKDEKRIQIERVRETERERDREKEIVPEREIDTVRTGIKEI